MLTYLPKWYEVVAVKSPDGIEKRAEAIEARVANVEEEEALKAAAVFLDLGLKENEYLSELGAVIQEKDPQFIIENGDIELKILMAAMLKELIKDKQNGLSDVVSYALAAGSFLGKRKLLIPDLLARCEKYLFDTSVAVRKKIDYDHEGLVKKLSAVSTVADQNGALNTLKAPLEACFKEIVTGFRKMARNQQLLKEESDILWWLYSHKSALQDIKPDKLMKGASGVVVAKELADFSEIAPGPYAHAEAFLSRMLSFEEAATAVFGIEDAVLAIPKAWREQTLKDIDFEEKQNLWAFCPVLFSLAASIKFGDKKGWLPEVETKFNFSLSEQRLTATQIAMQAFRECMLFKWAE